MNSISKFIDICLFKAGPEDVAASQGLMQLTLLVYFIIGVVIGLIEDVWAVSLVISLADLVMMMSLIAGLLYFRGFQARYQQTLTAMAGTGSCMGLMAFPILFLSHQVGEEAGELYSFALLLMIGVMVWSLMVVAHILRRSLEIKPGAAAVLTVVYSILSLVVISLAFSGAV